MALAVVGIAYVAAVLAGLVHVDFRFWIVALKPMSGRQALAFLAYLVPFTLFIWVAFRGPAAEETRPPLDALKALGYRAERVYEAGARGQRAFLVRLRRDGG
jgi:hypothetical protein